MAYPYASYIYDTTSSHAYWNATTHDSGTTFSTAGDTSWGYSRCSVVFSRTTPTGIRVDDMQIDLSIALDAGGGLISALGSTDMANAEGDLDTWWAAVKTAIHPDISLKEYVWRHLLGYGSKFSPAARLTARSVVGTSVGSRMPDQDAVTLTFRTASRRHWGRFYLPGYTTNNLSTGGRVAGGLLTALTGQTDTLMSNLYGHAGALILGVGSSKYYGFLKAKQIEVDDVWDIQRRRRVRPSAYAFKP